MPPPQHRRTQNILLFQKLLNLRDGASPFTLLLDSLESRAAKAVTAEFMSRAKISKTKIIFISFRTLPKPKLADFFIIARRKSLKDLRSEISSILQQSGLKTLLVIDTLNPMCSSSASALPAFLSSLLGPTVSLLGVYYTDTPVSHSTRLTSVYDAHPMVTLNYLATSILTLHSLTQVLAKKSAGDRSVQEPCFGLAEGREGVLIGLSRPKGKFVQRANVNELEQTMDESGVVVEMELRRKSGRGVRDTFVLIPGGSNLTNYTLAPGITSSHPMTTKIVLLDDHPLYAPQLLQPLGLETPEMDNNVTFSLGLTEKQRRDREGIVLPYFDAQKEDLVGSTGEGGRILYDMGREDDFDEEEDEI